ncbi:D-2-hydroxyacid dehydrogenase [Bordetella sp. 02P26C-1]|uniref:D-2-hydroxyacid dehydrogenase n=1 Tax=Bordetella sp. 02P26C-1 TaxID=2683195 RepID=UPI001352F3D8|nr:D-2-hydroxyacid dehydrogenase [Bordetella sp. 02P26C-1]MVW78252.1 D-2-hydroxyacid dehydrogenase [Bordetella sp. 02P26C-1]
MTAAKPARLLISKVARERLGDALDEAMQGCPFEVVTPTTDPDTAPGDIHVGYWSRDVTGLSTKHDIKLPLEAFYTSLRRSPDLQWVHVHSAGADRPFFAELAERKVRATTSPGVNADVVAQTALTGLLMLARHFPLLLEQQRERRWLSLVATGLPTDLVGQTALIAGWGPIGQRIAAVLRVLGVKVIVARSSNTPVDDQTETLAYEDIGQYAGRIDWLILACPLTERTRRWIDGKVLGALKPSARLINVARGEVVDQAALIEALQQRRLAGAYLDVFEHEPLDSASPLWSMENVIVTPHAAGHSDGNERRVDQIFLKHLREWAAQWPASA